MERSIKNAVKDALASPDAPQLTVRVDAYANGAHLHVTTPDGMFIGMLTYTALDIDGSLDALAGSFMNWIATLRNARKAANS